MSTPAAPAPAAPATPAAVPAVTPAPSPAPAAPPAKAPDAPAPETKSRGSKIFQLLAEESATEPGKKPEAKEPPKPEANKPDPAPAAPVEPKADDKPIKASKKAPISKRPEPPAPPSPAPAHPATPVAPAKAEDDWESQLVDEEKQMIADAEEAEKYLPNRKGLKEQVKKFVKEHQKYLEKHPDIDEDPDAKAAYETWLAKNRPTLTEADQRTVSEARIAERVQKPWEEKYSKLEHDIFTRDEEPKIKERVAAVASNLNSTVIPDEILNFAKQYGVDEAKKQFVDELEVVRDIVNAASSDYAELIRLGTVNPKNGRALAQPATDKSDPRFEQHQRLDLIVQRVNEDFKNTAGQKDLMRGGKWFCTRDEWNAGYHLFPQQYWTFTNEEIAERMMPLAKLGVEQAISQKREEMQRRGYERRKFTPPAAPTTPPTPVAPPPGPGSSPAPSGATPPANANTFGARLSSALTQA